MTPRPLLLLAGRDAVALAPRLTASGYVTIDWLSAGVAANELSGPEAPAAAILPRIETIDRRTAPAFWCHPDSPRPSTGRYGQGGLPVFGRR